MSSPPPGFERRHVVSVEDHLYHTEEMLDAMARVAPELLGWTTVCTVDNPGPDTSTAIAAWLRRFEGVQIAARIDPLDFPAADRRRLRPIDAAELAELSSVARLVASLLLPDGVLVQDVHLSTLRFIPVDRWWESIYVAATVRGMFDRHRPAVRFVSNKRGYTATFGRDLMEAGFDPRDVMDKSELEAAILPSLGRDLDTRLPFEVVTSSAPAPVPVAAHEESRRELVPPNSGHFGEFGWSGVMRGAAVIFFAYIGFDAVSTAAQEARNPQRDMPIGILGSLAICSVLYVAVAVVMIGLVPYAELGGPAPMAVTVDHARQAARGSSLEGLFSVMPFLVKIAILAGLTSTMVVQMMAQPRIFMAMSRDGLLPPWMGRVHSRFGTPHLTTVATGVVVALAAGLTPIDVLGHMVSIGTLFAFVVVSAGVLVLRRTHPELPRPFRTPWSPVVPALSAIVSLALMLSLPGATWTRLFAWMGVGMVIYFAYGYRRATLGSPGSLPAEAGSHTAV